MPQAAAAAFSWFLYNAGVAYSVVVAAQVTAFVVLNVALSVGLSKLSQALAGKPKGMDAGPQSRDVVVKSTIEPRQLIYGQVRTGGFLAFYGCSGTNNRFLWFVIAVAGHQVEDISDCWLGPQFVPDADIGPDGTVSTAEFQDQGFSRLLVRRFLGPGNQAVDGVLDTDFAEWTSNHKGLGVAYVSYRLDRSEKVWPTGAPSAFYHLVKGRRLYDPRKDSTNGGSGSHRVNDATTWEWSQNSALAVRDYISGGAIVYTTATPDKRLAMGEKDSRIDDAYVIASANICDENVLIPPASPTTTQKRYTCDVQLSCGTIHIENLRTLLSSMIGHASYVQGKYRVFAGAYDTPTVTLNEDDILGPVEIITHPQGEDAYNLVMGTFYDEDRGWQQTPFPAQTNSTYETDDGGQKPRNIELLATRTNYRAQRIARVHLEQSRQKHIIKFARLSPKAMNIAEWETFNVNVSEFGWSPQVMRCLDWEFLPEGFITITAKLEGSAPYADPVVASYITPTTSSIPAPQIEIPNPPISLSATAFPTTIVFTVGLPGYLPAGGVVEIWEHTSSTPFSSATKIKESRDDIVILPKRDTTTRYYWATIKNSDGRRSPEYPSGAGASGAGDLVKTADINAGAATEVFTVTVTNISIVETTGVPTGTFTDIAQIVFTASASGELLITAQGNCGIETPSTGDVFVDDVAAFSTRWRVNGSQVGPLRTYHADARIGFSSLLNTDVSRSIRMAATSGVTYTVILQGQKLSPNVDTVVGQLDMRVELIKR